MTTDKAIELLHSAFLEEDDADRKIRLLVVLNFLKGESAVEIARFLCMSRHKVYYWVRRFRERGLEGLSERPRSGRRPTVDYGDLRRALADDPEDYGYDRWTPETVRDYLKSRGVRVHPNYVYSILRRLGVKLRTQKSSPRVRTAGGAYLTQGHMEMMRQVSRMLHAPVDKIISESGVKPVLRVVQSGRDRTVLQGETELGRLTIIYEEGAG